MAKILNIPDVHGRDFWKKAKELINDVDLIIFLGDYLDPYSHENISNTIAIDNFKEILDFKKQHFDKVILLIGNHDHHYWPQYKNYWGCRRDDKNFDLISDLFLKNLNYFQLSYKYDKYLFTHAGVLNNWLKIINGEKKLRCTVNVPVNFKITVENLNDLLYENQDVLQMVGPERGGRDVYGSCIWADIHEHFYEEPLPSIYQVFGHTINYPKLYDVYIGKNFAMLDSQSCYILNTQNGEFIKTE